MGLRRYPLAVVGRAIRSGPMSDTSTLLLVIMAAVLVSMVLAIVIVRRSQVRASRALADLGGATLTRRPRAWACRARTHHPCGAPAPSPDRKSTRLNSSH